MRIKIQLEFTAPDDATHYRLDGAKDITFFKREFLGGHWCWFIATTSDKKLPMISHKKPLNITEIKQEQIA